MCHKCNYSAMLKESALEPTENRLRVLEIIGGNNFPLSAENIFNTVDRNHRINRVTVYRVLKLLVAHDLIEQYSSGGRSFFYGVAPNKNHPRHPHFYCRKCGQMNCLNPESLAVDTLNLEKTFPGQIDKVEIRVDGICKNCMGQ
ncbi:MAG: transcriptional repressor [Deltaproteobacteria bacterium]|jgi:Fur family transcriptional regulator, ferric uptake regulator|nr:transcriptional repressor [Deltaproteobacteria bacterium]MBT4266747.1 transcriptional repressor [Deltaproteobacteria bacterium]MBT4641116.1 transcriptional repressor [Deltaproteobacteria bacterium]MBT6505002.1 transcriptional repressor [Deltaproteobacteria bacterium]MBT6613535.1 transcriptional repressor [Deltaproteobacteria bacterium]